MNVAVIQASRLSPPPTSGGDVSLGIKARRLAVGYAFLAPLLVVTGVVIAIPAALSIGYSFTDWTGLGAAKFVGLDNYRRLLGDPEFHNAVWHNFVWTLYFLTVPIAMGLFGAFLLSRIQHYQMLFRVVYFIPYVVATVVSGAIWENLLSPQSGIGHGLANIGIPFLDGVNFFGDQRLASGRSPS